MFGIVVERLKCSSSCIEVEMLGIAIQKFKCFS